MRLKNRLPILGISLGVILMALAGCGGGLDRAQNQEAIEATEQAATVTVREIVNRVEVNGLHPETNDPAFVELQLGQFLQTGNLVKTHGNSSARVDISIQNFTRISRTSPNTIWRLGRFALNGETVIELQEGKIFVFDAGDGQEHWPLHIETPAGTASARGTWMAVAFDPETGTAQVECLRGICELENDLGYQVFTNEQVVVATAVTAPADPAPMDEQQIEAFKALPEVLTEELTIPVQFAAVEAKAKLEDARAAAVERKVLGEDRKISFVPASDDGDGPENTIPLAAANPADNGSDSGRVSNDSEPPASANRNSGQSGGNGQDKARNDQARGPDVASANGIPSQSGGDIQGKSRRDEAPGPRDGDAASLAFANRNSGGPGGDVQGRSRRDEAPGPRDKDSAFRASINGNSSRSGGSGPDWDRIDDARGPDVASNNSRSVYVSNQQDDEADSAGAREISLMIKLFRRLGFSSGEAATIVDQGQSDQIISAVAKKVAKKESKADKALAGLDLDEDALDSSTIVALWIETVKSGRGDSASSDGDSPATAKAAEELAKTETSTVFEWPDTGDEPATTVPADVPADLVNTVPVAVDDTASTVQDVGITIALLQNDSDENGDPLTVDKLKNPKYGTVMLNADNTVLYTPNIGYSGVDSFTYKANDGTDLSNIATVTVTVNPPPNAVPVAIDDTASTTETKKVSMYPLNNDSDGDGDPLTITNLTQPANGTASVKSDNAVDYIPNAGFTGEDYFTYTANDGKGDSNIATITVTVTANTVPVAVADTASTPKDVAVTIDVLQNDSDANGDPLTVTITKLPKDGTATVNGDNTMLYTPNAGFAGNDTFNYKANDGIGDSNVVIVTVTVNGLPVAVDDTASTPLEVAIAINVLQNDTDANGDPLTVTNLTQPTNGTASVNGDNTVLYTPNASFVGVDSFTYTANDGTGNSNVATVTVTVNALPVAVNDTATKSGGGPSINIDVLLNDTDANSDPLTVTNLTQPANGTVTVNPNKTVKYTPDSEFTGVDTFSYTANDGTGDSNIAWVTVTVS